MAMQDPVMLFGDLPIVCCAQDLEKQLKVQHQEFDHQTQTLRDQVKQVQESNAEYQVIGLRPSDMHRQPGRTARLASQ